MRTWASWVSVPALWGLAGWVGAAEPEPRAQRLIEFGWDEPDTAFMRKHVEQFEKSPFDGCVFHVEYQQPGGKHGNFTWECWGQQAFAEEDLKPAVEDLKATPFRRFKHNFLRFNTTPANIDWFDDFSAVIGNARLAARVAREGGCRGLLFDIEQYNAPLFDYAKQKLRESKSWDEYAQQVRRRGREVMAAFQEGYPDLVVFLTFGYCLPWEQSNGGKRPLAGCDYGLLAPFMDGLVETAAGRTRIVDGCELAYGYREAKQFAEARRRITRDLLPLVANQEKYGKLVSVSYGLWMDHDWRNKGWNVEDPSKNPISPEKCEAMIRAALDQADEFVWIYTETPRWWSAEGGPVKLPVAYDAAVRRAKAGGRTTTSQPAQQTQEAGAERGPDWLIDGRGYVARVEERENEVVLTNGLISRTFRLAPNAAAVAIDNLMTGQNELRSVRPEATITLDGRAYAIGGLVGQPIHNYLLPEWLEAMKADPAAFQYVGYQAGKTSERFAWKRRAEWMSQEAAWPPKGVSLVLEFKAPAGAAEGLTARVHYEMYDGIPLMCKWITVHNDGAKPVTLNAFTSEILAVVETGSMVGGKPAEFLKDYRSIQVETDYAFGGAMDAGSDNPSVHWKSDPLYESQVHYERQTPCLLECAPAVGPEMVMAPEGAFESFRTFELVHDTTERERRGLAVRRMYRTIAPWVTENPLIMHVRSADPTAVKLAIEQAADVGFELLILTFGSGFDIESEDPTYLKQVKGLADEAHGRGLAFGGYSLLASRSVDAANDVVNPATGKPGGFAVFGNSPCIGSKWGQEYFRKLRGFMEATGIDVLEHDGSYPGDCCASKEHPGHRGLGDSQWTQWRTISDYYKWCRGRGTYLNVPDWYYLSGSNKCGMGYRETNWSLPRAQQEVIERQNIFDGTWGKTPSMGWMFVPLTEYHGGGAAATIEPLHEHLDHYQARLANLLGAGVQACYRGPRLYDTAETRAAVKKWVDWFKQYRPILESDIVHGRRADGRDVDWLLHVNPRLKTRGMLVVYNPLPVQVERTLEVNLYYTGLTETAQVREMGGAAKAYTLDRAYRVRVPVTLEGRGMKWLSIE